MSNIEMLKPTHNAKGDLIVKSQLMLEGLQQLEELLEEIRDAMRGTSNKDLNKMPREKPPGGLLDLEDSKARNLAKCHQLATDIRQIVL
jgi:hypothetical protein